MKKCLCILLLLYSGLVFSHKSSDSYFSIDVGEINSSLQVEIAIQDLVTIFNFDQNNDGKLSWYEMKLEKNELITYVFSRMEIFSNNVECAPDSIDMATSRHSDGIYLVFKAMLPCDINVNKLKIDYNLLFDIDRQHRGLFYLKSLDLNQAFVFSPDNTSLFFDESNDAEVKNFLSFLKDGVWHIWIGYDHILFLISLLIPTVLFWQRRKWNGVEKASLAITEIIKVVSAFTLAHSITLSLVFLGFISLSVNIAESIIALSVVVAALLNVLPQISIKRWWLGFGFGLIHGFGFANVLSGLSVNSDSLFISLIGFNLGVELGQLAIVVILFPLAFYYRTHWFYEKIILKLGSYIIAMFGLVWFIERTL